MFPFLSKATTDHKSSLTAGLIFLGIFWAAIYLPGLGSEELKGEEPRRILPGMEMLRSGDWLQPRVAGRDYERKPPLINWIAASGIYLTGAYNEFSARLPGAILVLALGLGITAGVARTYGRETALLAGFLLLANFELMHKGRLLEIEATYVVFTGLAWAAWIAWVAGPNPKPWRGWTLAGVCLGLAFLAKGPVHLVMFYAVLIASHWTDRTLTRLRHPAHFGGVLVTLAVAIPWFLLVAARDDAGSSAANGEAAASTLQTWISQLTSRLDPGALDFGSWVSQIFKGIFNFFPAALIFLPLAWRPLRKRWMSREESGAGTPAEAKFPSARGLALGLIIGYLLIALTPAARARFSMPMLVPAAILGAVVFAQLNPTGRNAILCGWRRGIGGSLVFLALGSLIGPLFVPDEFRLLAAGMSLFSLAIAVLVIAARRRWLGNSWQRLMIVTALVMVGITGLYVGVIQPIKRKSEDLRPVAAALRQQLSAGETALIYKASYQPWIFYAWHDARELSSWDDLPDVLPGPIIFQPKYWNREQEKFITRYGEPQPIELIANPWDGDDLLVIRWENQGREFKK